MLRSLYSGISGMKVNQTKLDVIGNNIANVGTTSFKGARVRFQDMLSQNVSQALGPGLNQGGVNPRQVGLGVQMAGIDTMVSQGMMQPTSRNLDAAIDGDGYFMVGTGQVPANNGAGVGINNGKITNANNMAVQYTRDGSFTLDEQGNLLTSDGSRVLGYALVQTITNAGVTTTTNSVDYSTNGSLNFVDLNDGVNKPVAGNTLVPLKVPDSVIKNGNEMRIKTFSIGKDGVISAVLEDGSVTGLGQIAMASFKNPAGLSKVGKNLYERSANSGEPIVRSGLNAATDNSKGYGDMLQGMLEMSNVDLAEQFTDMIVTSRAFQANSKTITTGDEILQDILNLKR
ncbi:flagellar hook-basal body complex protein [Clostridium sp. YIM B02515]|uniref:Flagellar hook protein FlgE n=1 Tax=Clostridium rhizosphaerae TaxID=2803861 RepID=A0ABS1TGT4_9CLOT|nr:flagellar hook-basal body complex protein [Clostridium rhizosphaerae]MBL4937987.1 flagellar hook-basal body complex protein [Clostridium rhizosphaerae]